MNEVYTLVTLELNGEVKSIKEIKYKLEKHRLNRPPFRKMVVSRLKLFNIKGIQTSEVYMNDEANIFSVKYYRKDGKLKYEGYLSDNGFAGEFLNYKYKFGLLQKKIRRNGFGFKKVISVHSNNKTKTGYEQKNEFLSGGDNIQRTHAKSYNDSNKLIEESETDSKGNINYKQTLKYDKKGNLNKVKESHRSDNLCSGWEFRYNENNQVIYELKRDKYLGDEYSFKYSYDENKRLVKRICNDADLNFLHSFENIYDSDNGLLLKKIVCTNKSNSEEITEYKYDEFSNWFQKKKFIGETLIEITEREIKYYGQEEEDL